MKSLSHYFLFSSPFWHTSGMLYPVLSSKFPQWNKRKGNLSTTFVVTLIWAIDQENILHSNLMALSSLEKTRVDTVVLVPVFRFRDRQGLSETQCGKSISRPSEHFWVSWKSPEMAFSTNDWTFKNASKVTTVALF